jgi:transglutaminase-like putative cysteine protease
MLTNKRSYAIASAFLIALAAIWLFVSPFSGEPDYEVARHIEYSYTVHNRSNRLVKNPSLEIPAPVKQTATQKTIAVECSLPMSMETDTLGNQLIKITLQNLPPFSSRQINIAADLMHSEKSHRQSQVDPKFYKHAEKYIESDHSDIRRLAASLKARSELETARNLYKWVSEHIQYAGFLRNRRGALQTLRTRKGDCTEFADLFIALCRANGIPCRGVAGYVAKSNAVLTPNGFHNWAEFYAKGRWYICDPQGKRFMKYSDRYLAMHILATPEQTAATAFARFKVSDDTLKVRMNS